MPSRYEPCGLNQMYSLMYGTVPLVRAVGGLADSVVDASAAHLADGSATGFVFGIYDSRELARQIERAVDMYRNHETWQKLVEAGMRQDWSWCRSAQEYVPVYQAQAQAPGIRRSNTLRSGASVVRCNLSLWPSSGISTSRTTPTTSGARR